MILSLRARATGRLVRQCFGRSGNHRSRVNAGPYRCPSANPHPRSGLARHATHRASSATERIPESRHSVTEVCEEMHEATASGGTVMRITSPPSAAASHTSPPPSLHRSNSAYRSESATVPKGSCRIPVSRVWRLASDSALREGIPAGMGTRKDSLTSGVSRAARWHADVGRRHGTPLIVGRRHGTRLIVARRVRGAL